MKNVCNGVLATKTQYKDKPTGANQKYLNIAQKQLNEAYANAEAEYIKVRSTAYQNSMQQKTHCCLGQIGCNHENFHTTKHRGRSKS